MLYQIFTNYKYNTWFDDKYYDFFKDGYYEYCNFEIIEKDGKFFPEDKNNTSDFNEFCHWKKIKVKIIDENENYFVLKIIYWSYTKKYCQHDFPCCLKDDLEFLILKDNGEKIIKLYNEHNQDIIEDKKQVMANISKKDNNILDMAENLLNIAEENIMLNYRIVARCHNKYSHVVNDKKENKYFDDIYSLRIFTHDLKGKEKKEAENYNANLDNKYNEFTKIIDNFVEIIMEEKNLNIYVARAIAWDAIQKKTIEYYTNKWLYEYDMNFEKSYNDICTEYQNQDINIIIREYIKSIILHNEIDINNIIEILMYFLLSKKYIVELILYNQFVDFYELIKDIKYELESLNIKQKLKTQKERKIIKYTIDDIDLMTGLEFEKFIELLFRKMGYSTQLTKQSGDQGIDIIAIKNNINIGVQAKCYSNSVSNTAIQEVVAGISYYNCNKAIVITNNHFTSSAIDLAQSNNVVLWDRNMLKEKIAELF